MRNFRQNNRQGYTLIEMLCVIVIIGILAAYIMPGTRAALEKDLERAARIQLEGIKAGMYIYRSRSGGNFPTASIDTVEEINSVLDINAVETEFELECDNSVGPDEFHCFADIPDSTNTVWTLEIDSAVCNGKVQCSGNGCPSIPDAPACP